MTIFLDFNDLSVYFLVSSIISVFCINCININANNKTIIIIITLFFDFSDIILFFAENYTII